MGKKINLEDVISYIEGEGNKHTYDDITSKFDISIRTARTYLNEIDAEYAVDYEKTNNGKNAWYVPQGVLENDPANGGASSGKKDEFFKLLGDFKDGITRSELNNKYNINDEKVDKFIDKLREKGHDIQHEGADGEEIYYLSAEVPNKFSIGSEGEKVKFGIVSDTHLGSEAEQMKSLEKYYDKLQEEDVDIVLHAGDISDGIGVYRGQIQHKKDGTRTWSDLIDYVAENYPQREGIHTFFIEGNHDAKMFDKTGIHLGEELERRRDDLHYIGDNYANLDLGGLNIDIVHPSGGQPYTLGYRAQTWLRDKPSSEIADVTIFGHLHQFLDAESEGSQVIYAGAFQGSTPYLNKKGIKPKAGGWIVEAELSENDEDQIESWIAQRIQFSLEDKGKFERGDLRDKIKKESEQKTVNIEDIEELEEFADI